MFERHTHPKRKQTQRLTLPLKLLLAVLFTGGNWLPALSVLAAPPAPGTVIRNQATGSFVNPVDSSTTNIESNEVVVRVAEVAGITVSSSTTPTEAPSNVSGAGSQQGNGVINPGDVVYFTYTITNIGNDPTQFFIPGAPSAVTNGALQGNIEIIGFDPDGAGSTAATDLSSSPVTIPTAGATTGALTIPGLTGGSLPASGVLTVRVPIKVSTSASMGDQVTIVLGDTTPTDQQNQPFVDGGNNRDLYTQDNSGTDNGDANGDPINGDATNHRQEASASQQATVNETIDFGDAPDTYGDASHEVTALYLGSVAPDGEADTQPGPGADGDDNNGTDDEDGVTSFPALDETTTAYSLTATINNGSSNPANVFAWIDFDRDGQFDEDERATVDSDTIALDGSGQVPSNTNGTVKLKWSSIGSNGLDIQDGASYVRVRVTQDDLDVNTNETTNQDDASVGAASDGEVEDYAVAIAAASTPVGPACIAQANTTFNSANFPLNQALQGSTIPLPTPLTFNNGSLSFNTELSGSAAFNAGIQVQNDPAPGFGPHLFVQSNNSNSFLNTNNQATYVFSFPTPVTDFAMVAGGLNNDDGTYIIATLRGVPVQITAANFSNLSTGMSFRDEDGDGQSDTVVSQNQDNDPGVITNTYNLSIPGPIDEIRVVTGKEDNNGGNVTLGFLSIEYCADPDYGDAPLTYDDTTGDGTLNSSDTPAQHTISSTLHLGATRPDAEAAPQSSAAANGDDAVNTPAVDDEDGITTFPVLEQTDTSYSLTTTVNNTNNVPANVYAWIDFDRDGEFDEDERAADATVAANSTNAPVNLSWSNIGSSGPDITAGASYVRVRVTTEDLDSSADTTNRDDASVGSALDGEVEDYGVTITAAAANDPNLLLVKRITRVNGQTTNGSTDLDVYVNAPDYPYDDNDLDNPAPNPIDTENWPNTPNSNTSGFLRGQTNGGETQPGDEVEYTIYFLSDGSQDAEDVQFCDRIPNSQTFVPDTFNAVTPAPGGGAGANRGILVEYDGDTFSFSNDNDGDTAQFFPPGAVLPDVCSNVPNQSEDNGAVVVNLGTIPHANSPGTPNDSFGLIRFRAVVK
ncbi:hypothetical protein C1752_13892 [Acaryochloris thomasi RCC1774]|uniref:GEVED domain-containing protein n=1 Tax=Acaryochloris thomasi RCC1774 TaxID=1764569 RepID=A0A2W1JN77_9CYAN|nr:GEVED domain-containing protein [Acaryochloris thomasi]PZD70357.1 hypothetical protein C1752_13892 [Acaryochloris thomasi RCC1774]